MEGWCPAGTLNPRSMDFLATGEPPIAVQNVLRRVDTCVVIALPDSSKWFQYINLQPGIYNCCSCMLLPTCYIWGDVHFQGRIPGRWARALRPAGNSLVQLNLWFNSFGSCKYLGRQSFIKNVFDKIKKYEIWKIKIMKYIILYYIIFDYII